jgi:general nucleoside transport system ATP-binding protein
VLRLSRISKRFGALQANDEISLQLAPGEVLALLGENGAGKSTLVSILFGHYVADAGTIEIDGKRLPPGEPRAALAAGIGMVHQHFSLADNLSVLDNVMIGQQALSGLNSDHAGFRAQLRAAAADYGLAVNPDALVRDLSVGERQRVEILKALLRGARYLILDEPTAVLTPGEVEQLFATLKRFVSKGLAVIFISHKLPEVLAVSDRIMVLRAGRVVAELPTADANVDGLASAMIGRSLAPAQAVVDSHQTPAVEPVAGRLTPTRPTSGHPMQGGPTQGSKLALRVYQLSLNQARRGVLNKLDFEVRRGEIFAIAGVAGNGQQLLADLLCGTVAANRGTIEVYGRPMVAKPSDWIAAGVARIPEDRLSLGVVADATLDENAILNDYRNRRYCRWPGMARVLRVLDRRALNQRARIIATDYDVRHSGFNRPIKNLSGGNIQKFILGRELADTPKLVIANQPTWGLDVGAVQYVHQQLRRAQARDAAIVLISEDLDEIFTLADRIAVLYRGKMIAARPSASWSVSQIGLAMAGQAV